MLGYPLLILDVLRFVFDTVFLLARAAVAHPGRTVFLLVFGGLALLFGLAGAVVTVVLVVAGAAVLRWTNWPLWHRLIGWWWRPMWVRWWVYERRWRPTMKECWLSVIVDNGLDVFPPIKKVRVSAFGHVVAVRMLVGQKRHDYEVKADEIGTAFGAQSCRAFPYYRERRQLRVARAEGRVRLVVRRGPPHLVPGLVSLEFAVKDPLAALVPPVPIPASADAIDYGAVPVGLTENGTPWTLKIHGAHTLIAGLTGAGKGSVIQSVLKGLAPAIRDGIVEVWAIDPKGGMELYGGRPLYKRYCDSSRPAMAAMLSDAVTITEDRTQRLKGATRQHMPSVAEPLILVIVDEFASLMVPRSKSKDDVAVAAQVKASATLIVNMGRAVGVVLLGALQNPRKEVVDMRDEIPERVAMRLLSAEYTDMMFWRGAAASGIRCDLILKSLPGTGYAWSDDARAIVRVRAAFVDDAEIHELALTYQPPGNLTDAQFEAWLAKTAVHGPPEEFPTVDEVLDDIEASAAQD